MNYAKAVYNAMEKNAQMRVNETEALKIGIISGKSEGASDMTDLKTTKLSEEAME